MNFKTFHRKIYVAYVHGFIYNILSKVAVCGIIRTRCQAVQLVTPALLTPCCRYLKMIPICLFHDI